MKDPRKYIPLLLALFLVIILIAIALVQKYQLRNNAVIVRAYVTKVEGQYRNPGTVFLEYEFTFEGKNYTIEGSMGCSKLCDWKMRILLSGKTILIVVNRKSPESTMTLLRTKQLEFFGADVSDEYRAFVRKLDTLCDDECPY